MLTEGFEMVPGDFDNFRETISPKIKPAGEMPGAQPVPYTQVFENKFPFIPNLSVLDLLFNTGPGAGAIIRNSL